METIWTALIAAASAIIGAVITGLFLRRKTEAETTDLIVKSATSLIEPLNKQVESMQKQLDRQKKNYSVVWSANGCPHERHSMFG